MKETLLQAWRIMRVCLTAAVMVSTISFIFDTEPPQKDKPQFFEVGNSTECIEVIVQVTDEIEKTNDVVVEHGEDEKAVPPFDFKVNVITETQGDIPSEKAHCAYQIIPSDSTAIAFEELERRKKYFISFCKRCLHSNGKRSSHKGYEWRRSL